MFARRFRFAAGGFAFSALARSVWRPEASACAVRFGWSFAVGPAGCYLPASGRGAFPSGLELFQTSYRDCALGRLLGRRFLGFHC